MAEHGGYRKPANPAMVSGPGSLSQRTDGGPGQPQMSTTGQPYGAAQAMAGIQAGAPMSDVSDGGQPGPPIVPLDAPSTFPGEHVTHGAELGPGGGPSVLGATPQRRVTEMLSMLMGDDISGDLEELYLRAEQLGL